MGRLTDPITKISPTKTWLKTPTQLPTFKSSVLGFYIWLEVKPKGKLGITCVWIPKNTSTNRTFWLSQPNSIALKDRNYHWLNDANVSTRRKQLIGILTDVKLPGAIAENKDFEFHGQSKKDWHFWRMSILSWERSSKISFHSDLYRKLRWLTFSLMRVMSSYDNI